jgi:hypothetical protein
LAIFKKRIAEPHSAEQRRLLLRLLAEEQAKDNGANDKST